MVELLNTSYSNLSQRLRDLSAGARLTILFLLLLVLASIWIMVPSGEGNEEYLFGGREFSNLELADMEQAALAALEDPGRPGRAGHGMGALQGRLQFSLNTLVPALTGTFCLVAGAETA